MLVNQDKSVHNCCTSAAAGLPPEKIKTLPNQTEPVSPPLGDKAHIKGKMVLAIVVDTTGAVTCVEFLSGHPLIVLAAIDSVRRRRFHPFIANGVQKNFCGKIILGYEASEYGLKYEVI